MKLYNVQETAELLLAHPNTIRRWNDEGKIKSFRTPGRQRRFHLSEINRLRKSMGLPEIKAKEK